MHLLVALIMLVCYYFGLSLIQISRDMQSTFVILIFVGYFVLGAIFGFLFRKDILTNFALVLALGFLGTTFSIVSYRALFDSEALSQALHDLANIFIASFFIGITAATGTLVHALFAWVRRWRARKKTTKEAVKQTNILKGAEIICQPSETRFCSPQTPKKVFFIQHLSSIE